MAENNGRQRKTMWSALSLWALLAKGSFYKVLAVAFLMVMTETALFFHALQGGLAAPFDLMIEESRIHLVFLAALGAAYFLLIRMNRILDNEGRYTVMRLRATQTQVFAVRTVYDALCLLTLLAVQVGLVLCFSVIYGRTPGMQQGPQTLFLAFYRSRFLHGLLPMADTGKWVRNGLMLLAMGMEEAGGVGKRYRVTQVSVYLMAASWFAAPVGLAWQDRICCFVYAVVMAADLLDLYKSRKAGAARETSVEAAEGQA